MKVLQIASSNMEFFREQVRILEQKGISCDVMYATSRSTDQHKDGSGVLVESLNRIYGHNPLYYGFQSASFLPAVMKKSVMGNYDLVHVNSGMAAPFGLLQPTRPLVTTLWGDDLLGNRLYGYYSDITKFCARKSDATIVRSNEMKREISSEAYIIPSGVDMDKFKPIDQSVAIDIVGWDDEKKHVLFPYHPSQSKKRYPLAQNLIDKVNSEIEEEVILQTVHGVSHEKMNIYYSAADVLLLPSRREGSPNTVKEAMACNTPIVSTNTGDVQERLKDVEPSAVSDSEAGLTKGLLQVLRANSRSNGRDHVHEVSLDSMGNKLIDIYTLVLNNTGSSIRS